MIYHYAVIISMISHLSITWKLKFIYEKKIASLSCLIILVLDLLPGNFLDRRFMLPKKNIFYISTGETYEGVKADLNDLKIISGEHMV